jgi:ATP-dependent DNA ligase
MLSTSFDDRSAQLDDSPRFACRMGLEDIVSKRADSPYRAGQSRSWLKIKNRKHPALGRVMESFAR